MTEKQEKWYWREWKKVCDAQGWHVSKTRLAPLRAPRNEEESKVITFAHQLAKKESQAVTLDNLRHACHMVALGQDKGHMALNNKEWDRVFNLFQLLIDELNIDARINFEHPQNAERGRLIWSLQNHFKAPYVATVCRNKFGTEDYHSLEIDPLRDLHRTISSRPNARLKNQENEPHPF